MHALAIAMLIDMIERVNIISYVDSELINHQHCCS